MPIKEKTKLILISKAGNLCSFAGCEQTLTSDPSGVEGPVLLGEVAHIVAQQMDGPRGKFPLPHTKMDEYENLMYLCPTHHEQIDKQVETFPVEKLLHMKQEHERWVAERLSRTRRFERMREPEQLVKERVTSTVLPVRQMPAYVFAAPCGFREGEVKEQVLYPRDRRIMFPFIIRGKTLYSFTDLRANANAFAKAINPEAAGRHSATDWWKDPDRMHWHIDLLNRSLNKLTGRLGLQWDKEHKRYYFDPLSEEELSKQKPRTETKEPHTNHIELDEGTARDVARFRSVTYKTLGGQHRPKQVAYRPSFKNGGYKNYWEHVAVSLRFHYLGSMSWGLSFRPERRFTRDGHKPLTPKGTGRRATNRKSHMYNADFHGEVHFWKEYLSRRYSSDGSAPWITFSFGEQAIIVENGPLTVDIEWPGVPNDVREIHYIRQEEDLFSLTERDAFSGYEEDGEDAGWGTDEEWENL